MRRVIEIVSSVDAVVPIAPCRFQVVDANLFSHRKKRGVNQYRLVPYLYLVVENELFQRME